VPLRLLALLKEVNMRRIICLLILISLTLTGCANPTKEREEMIQKTFEDAKILNEKSFLGTNSFGKCFLLKKATDADYIVTPYRLEDEKSNYYYFPFNDNNYITQIVLETSSYHVFGIHIDDGFSIVENILKQEGYKKDRINDNLRENTSYVVFKKDYISISFRISLDENETVIKKIIIDISDPKYAGIDY
jgi:hypothetical protein